MPIIRSASDWHCSVLEDSNYDDYTLAQKHAYFLATGDQARTEGAQLVVLPGDTLDERGRNRSLVRDADVVQEALERFGGSVVAQRGNHDAEEHFKRKEMRRLLGRHEIVGDATCILPGGVMSAHGHGWDKKQQRELALELVHYSLLLGKAGGNGETAALQKHLHRTYVELIDALAEVDASFRVSALVQEYREAMGASLMTLWRQRAGAQAETHPVIGNPHVAMKLVRKTTKDVDLASPFAAAHMATMRGCRVALVGHTHRPDIDTVQTWSPQEQRVVDVLVANNGSPIQRGCELLNVMVDTDAGAVELQAYEFAADPEESRFVTRKRCVLPPAPAAGA